MKTKLIVCIGTLSLMSTSMVFAAASYNSSSYYKKSAAKSSKNNKQKQIKSTSQEDADCSEEVACSVEVESPPLEQMQPQINPFMELPALHVWGYGGSHTIGQGQGLIPLMSSNQNKNLYLLAEAKETANTAAHYFGFGGGYRQIIGGRIFGGYLIADENFTDNLADKEFLVLNPGLETLGDKWDFRINGYFPVGSKSWNIDTSETNLHFAGHDELVDFSAKQASIGNGVDAEIGAKIPKLNFLKAFIGGYYFDEKDASSITGASGRLEYAINNYLTLEARDTNDNYNNNMALVGFKVSLGGVENKGENGISDRLLDPIEHNLATAAIANSVPIRIKSKLIAANQKINQNPIEFVDNNISQAEAGFIGDGTFEHPYNELNNDVIANIQAQPGTNAVDIYVENGPYNMGGSLDLPNDYSIFGRTDHFADAAAGSDRPELDGNITVSDDTTIDSVQVMNDGTQNAGISMAALASGESRDIILNNIIVGTNNTADASKIFDVGLDTIDANVTISNSQIDGASTLGVNTTAGIQMNENVTLNLGENNTIQGSQIGIVAPVGTNQAIGILAGPGSTINITGDNNNIFASNTNSGDAAGITETDASPVHINISSSNNTIAAEINSGIFSSSITAFGVILGTNNSTLNITGNGNTIEAKNFDGGSANGIFSNAFNTSISISSNNNTISAISQTPAAGALINHDLNSGLINDGAVGINLFSSDLSISGSGNAINATSDNGISAGVGFSQGNLLIANTAINVTNSNVSSSSQAFGVVIQGSAPDSVNMSNNSINVTNASTMPSSLSDGIEINIASGSPNDFIFENNNFDVKGGENSIGIISNIPVSASTAAAWKADNIFGGDITPGNQVVVPTL